MKDQEKEQKAREKEAERIGFWANKSFYALCAVCLLAIGFASWTAYREFREVPTDTASPTPSSYVSPAPSPSAAPKKTVSEPPAASPAPTEQEIKQSATEAAPVDRFFILPLSGCSVYKPYNGTDLQYSNTYGDYRLHAALDLVSESSDVVTACGDGIVAGIANDPLRGTVVTVDHGNGVTAAYCGLKEAVKVAVGDTVSSTTELGTLGTVPCECLDTAHLHLEFYRDGVLVSPSDYLK